MVSSILHMDTAVLAYQICLQPLKKKNKRAAVAQHHHRIYNQAGKVETADREPHGGAVKTQAAAFLHHFTL